MEDLSGKKFNNWLVIEYCGKSEWLCECQCENKTLRKVRTYMLKSGGSKSCGCGRVTSQEIDLTGKQFGYWKVICKDKEQKRHFICKCTKCNEITRSVFSGDLKSGKSVSCGCSTRVDITNNSYGELFVESYNKDIYKYKCICSCGNVIYATRYDLESGRTKTCGKHAKYEDLSGKQFGEWTAIEYLGNYTWKCQCSCGNVRNISRYDLVYGKSTNCGHSRKENLFNKRFGKLRTLRYLGNCSWECMCDCGNIKKVTTANLKSGGTISCGCANISLQHAKSYDEVIKSIDNYIAHNNSLPFPDDIAKSLEITTGAVYKYIRKYYLQDKFNKYFGSRPERDIYNFVCQFTDKVILHDKKVLNGKELDIYIPSHKLAIEFNGNYWHSFEKLEDKKYHQQKTLDCAKQGIQLIHIFEYEWNDLVKQEKIKNYIKRLITKDNQNRVFARNTEIKQISSTVADEFCTKYHLQGKATASINYGCYLDDELIGVMTFGAPRFNNNYDYELVRLCWKDSVAVTGGTEKLLSQFIKYYNPNSIITYCDISKFTGNAYIRIGFKPIQSNTITEPNYVWCSQETDLLLPRYKTQKHQLIEQGLGTEEQTEIEIMHNHNFIQIYDCGNLRLEWIRK